jgi:hypothetical protein
MTKLSQSKEKTDNNDNTRTIHNMTTLPQPKGRIITVEINLILNIMAEVLRNS